MCGWPKLPQGAVQEIELFVQDTYYQESIKTLMNTLEDLSQKASDTFPLHKV